MKIKSICDIAPDKPFEPGDVNTWPVQNNGKCLDVLSRPWWRYPARHDFFVISNRGGRIDWASREIDRHAVNARGDIVSVCIKMNWWQIFWYWPKFQKTNIPYHITNFIWKFKNLS